ncbi:MAG: putative toxin-antitoxin system toxin component, PIN family [Candidatus Altiarchaeales archaeon WOR_SM1_86-2]|nr:MAG: putative toxin-antitoxin system toxin component, PIN family [Candidatus Altiarchaeales archaeon WOR_SM1_86-2]ODS37827.1 MAG: putative toxin-antitoxin system toxin component, PIN family [Candidatus Altiarchaeales archaeon WOR_SM1_79]
MKIVVDTNTLISALGWGGNEYRLIEKCMLGEVTLVLSLDILKEFKGVAKRDKFGFTGEDIDEFVDALVRACIITQPDIKLDVVGRDPKDNMILGCGVSGNAEYIASGDNDLLYLEEYEGIRIVRTKRMLELIEER